ncbi:MAG TPA: glutamyl-tRNA reductase [Chloroflexota bacterium]|nr:glutamyl-tRNA reductase [Chloroflexota bacterium]
MPQILVVGLSHRTSPVEIREQLALSDDQRRVALQRLRRHLTECVIVSTCNRVEVYTVVESGEDEADYIVGFLASFHGLTPEILRPHVYVHRGNAAVRHVFAVACGLDSMIVGEPQILGQIRADYEAAKLNESVGAILSRIFQFALRVGKQVRTETGIARAAGSVSLAAVELARRAWGDLGQAAVVVIGTGMMGEQAARAVASAGVGELFITNRTYGRAIELASRIGGKPAELATLPSLIARADVVFSSTAAPQFILDRPMVARAMSDRPHRRLVLVDIAVPRDVDPLVQDLANVELHDIDDLQAGGITNLDQHRRDVTDARRLVAAEADRFNTWLEARSVLPTITALRERYERIRQAEVDKAIGRMGVLSDRQRGAVDAMSKAIVNKILHRPTVQLKAAARSKESNAVRLSIARELLGLDDPTASG